MLTSEINEDTFIIKKKPNQRHSDEVGPKK